MPATGRWFVTNTTASLLLQGHDLGPGLHARALLGQDELAADEVIAGAVAQDGGLQEEVQVAVKVLVQAVVVAGSVAQQQRRGPRLPGAAPQRFAMAASAG